MYISFVGLGGAGKTTIAKGVEKKLNYYGYTNDYYFTKFINKSDTIFKKIFWSVYLWRFFNINLFFVYYFLRKKHAKDINQKFSLINTYTALKSGYYLSRVKKKKVDLVIFEEDYITFIGHLILSNKNSEKFLIKTTKKTVLTSVNSLIIVFIDTKPNLSALRYCNRENIYDSKSRLEIEKKYNLIYKGIKKSFNIVSNIKNTITIEVDGTKPPEENIEKVAEVALALLRERENNSA